MTDFSNYKLYDCASAPSPRRVRIFIAELGLDIPTVQVDLGSGEQLSDDFKKINPHCEVPALQLDNGSIISEGTAICLYLDAITDGESLFGTTPEEKAMICMWNRRIEMGGFLAIAEAFRNSVPGFKDRGISGPVNFPQIPELAERGRTRLPLLFEELNEQLSANEFIAGHKFSYADVTALMVVDFAKAVKVRMTEEQTHLKRWYDNVSSRPSAKA